VNFNYLDYKEAIRTYTPDMLKNGFNTISNGEKIFFISTPSAGLWTTKDKMLNPF